MKQILLFVFISLLALKITAQSSVTLFAEPKIIFNADSLPKLYVGAGFGLNNSSGVIGIVANYRLIDRLFAQGGFGLGLWGFKYTVGLKYDFNYLSGFSAGMGMSFTPGSADFSDELETTDGVKTVNYDRLTANTFNLKGSYNWILTRSLSVYLDLGYAITLKKDPWKLNDPVTLTSNAKYDLNLETPGGVIVGFGFLFGFGR